MIPCLLPHADICKQTVPDGWSFYSYKDSSGNDLGRTTVGNNWTQLAAACESIPWCRAVNSNGNLKSALLPEAQWGNSFSDVCSGLLVKSESSSAANCSFVCALIAAVNGLTTDETGPDDHKMQHACAPSLMTDDCLLP